MGEKKEVDTLYYEDEAKENNKYKNIDMTEKEHILSNTNSIEYDLDDYESSTLEEKSNNIFVIIFSIVIVLVLILSLILLLS